MTATAHREEFGPIFDADNHYWETAEAFMRYRSPQYRDRGLRLVQHEGQVRYFMGDQIWPMLPGPGDLHARPVPGSLFDYFAGKEASTVRGPAFSQDPKDHPEYFHRDARIACMDQQGVEASWMFPTHGVCIEGPMQRVDPEAALDILRGFNRWIDEEWGFAYQNRIFGIPLLSLTDRDAALAELEWVLERGARVIAMRHGPVWTPDGFKSPAHPDFDPFWARVQEAGITVGIHAGHEEGYREVHEAVARAWGYTYDPFQKFDPTGTDPALTTSDDWSMRFIMMLQKGRLISDYISAMIMQGLFDRFPRLRMAIVEFGGGWVPHVLHSLQFAHIQNKGMFKRNPVDTFNEHIWVAPFVEDNAAEMAKFMPVERIIYGSDWPHGEGLAHPRDYFATMDGMAASDVRKIMLENARALTYA